MYGAFIGQLSHGRLALDPDFVFFHVDPGSRGWAPHRDRPTMPFLPVAPGQGGAGQPRGAQQGDPGPPAQPLAAPLAHGTSPTAPQPQPAPQPGSSAVRALPAAAGEALLWSGRLLHWGGVAAACPEAPDCKEAAAAAAAEGANAEAATMAAEEEEETEEKRGGGFTAADGGGDGVHGGWGPTAADGCGCGGCIPRVAMSFAACAPEFEDPALRGVDLSQLGAELHVHQHTEPLPPQLAAVLEAVEAALAGGASSSAPLSAAASAGSPSSSCFCMSGAESMAFWSIVLPGKGKEVDQEVESSETVLSSIHVTGLALGTAAAKGPHVVSIEYNGTVTVLATLEAPHTRQVKLDIALDQTFKLANHGDAAVYAYGYQANGGKGKQLRRQRREADEEDEEEDEDDEDDGIPDYKDLNPDDLVGTATPGNEAEFRQALVALLKSQRGPVPLAQLGHAVQRPVGMKGRDFKLGSFLEQHSELFEVDPKKGVSLKKGGGGKKRCMPQQTHTR
eukprot:XP_001694007.1 predicted protein [Chlamydomonas reinhardtii]